WLRRLDVEAGDLEWTQQVPAGCEALDVPMSRPTAPVILCSDGRRLTPGDGGDSWKEFLPTVTSELDSALWNGRVSGFVTASESRIPPMHPLLMLKYL
ncbi:MAG: hypothetical protein AAGJ52_10515, partial [Pseudomonadota bacterium]